MPNPFWNSTEHRLRAVWRILLLFVFYIFISGVFSYIVIGLAILVGGISFSDPSFLNQAILYVQMRPAWRAFSILMEIASVFAWLWVAGRLLDRRPLADFGFHLNRGWWLDFGFGCLLGAVLMALIFGIERAAGWVEVTGMNQVQSTVPVIFAAAMAVSFLHYISVAVSEESLFRGYLLRNLAEGLHFPPRLSARTALLLAFVLSSSVFGAAHLANPNASLVSTLNIVAAGIFLGLGYVLTGELAIPIGVHLTWNFFQGNVFGFPVSGTGHVASVYSIHQLGPDAWTGGAFGPEAGIIGLLAIGLGCLLTLLYLKWRYGTIRPEDRLAVYTRKTGQPARAAAVDPDLPAAP
jgi:membrane protease YdiL (CAAX protease family)